jgi:arylsulfatase A-like enzyme/Tfp pilus assembly protein PilF
LSLALLLLAGCDAAGRAPKNVLLVTIDTLRADRLGAYGGSVPTPHLDRLAREGTSFGNAFSASPLTLPSHSSILTGTLPTVHGVRDNGRFRLGAEMETAAEMLKRSGFRTAAFVGAFPLDSRFGLDQGFDVYDDSFGGPASRSALAERRGAAVVGVARAWLEANRGERTFAWVHLFDPHAPYAPPPPFPAGYEGEVAYVDHVLGDLFSAASSETLVIVMADHGEGLGEHGEDTHSLFIYDSTIRIPLLMRGPGIPAGASPSSQVRSIDVLPTILELLGEEELCPACEGESLVPLLRGQSADPRPSYAETYFPLLNLGWSELQSVRSGGWKYIDAPEPELYHVESDPGELSNVIGANREKAEELSEHLASLDRAAPVARAPVVDAETLDALRSLGYASAAVPPAPSSRPDPKARLQVWEGVRRGMDLSARGEWALAIAELESVTREEPDLLLARTHLAAAYFESGRYGDAVRECGAILAREGDDYDATLLLGKTLLRLGRGDESRKILARAAELDPASAAPWVELSQLSLRRSKAEAERFLAEARSREPEASGVLVMEGKLAVLNGDAVSAEGYFRKALEGAPYDVDARVQLGNLLLAQRRLEDAQALFEDGLRSRPDAAAYHVGLGHSLALSKKMEPAIAAFEKALSLDPRSTLVLNSLGFAYLEAGRPGEAMALFQRSLELDLNQAELVRFLQQARAEPR